MAHWLWGDRPEQGKGCHVRTVMGRPARGSCRSSHLERVSDLRPVLAARSALGRRAETLERREGPTALQGRTPGLISASPRRVVAVPQVELPAPGLTGQ